MENGNRNFKDIKFPPITDLFGNNFDPLDWKQFKKGWEETLDFVLDAFSDENKNIVEPPYCIKLGDKESKIFINVAGIQKQNIAITIQDTKLIVEYPDKKFYEDKATKAKKFLFKIGSEVDIESIQSKLEDGVLVISIDKKEPLKKVVEIK